MKPRHPSWIYWDKNAKRVRIHLTKRGACQDGYGAHTDDREFGIAYGWQGANSYAAALKFARQKQREFRGDNSFNCALCYPEQLSFVLRVTTTTERAPSIAELH
jgi:hypothetical protein